MNGIDPKITFWIGVATSVLLGIGNGSGHLPAWVSPNLGSDIISTCAFLGWINTMVLTALSGYSSMKPGPMMSAPLPPAAKPLILLAVLLTGLLAFASEARAQQPKPLQITGNLQADIKANTQRGLTGSPVNDLIGMLDAKLLPDLVYAKKLADASGSKVTGPCYGAWIDIINVRQKAVQDDQTPPQALPMPEDHVVTDFEKLVEVRNSLQPDSPFMISCSPVASMVKKDIAGFVGLVIGGGASLAALVPGL